MDCGVNECFVLFLERAGYGNLLTESSLAIDEQIENRPFRVRANIASSIDFTQRHVGD